MTISDVHTFIASGLEAYANGGAEWLLQGVVKAATFDAVDDTQSGKAVYGWLGAGRPIAGNSATTSFDLEIPIYLRGCIVGDLATLDADAVSMTDDLIRALLVGNGDNSGDVSGRTELSSFAEPQIDTDGRKAHVLVVGRAIIPKEVQ